MIAWITLFVLFCALFVAVCTGYKNDIEKYKIEAVNLRNDAEYYRKRAIDFEFSVKELSDKNETLANTNCVVTESLGRTRKLYDELKAQIENKRRSAEQTYCESQDVQANEPVTTVKPSKKTKPVKVVKKTAKCVKTKDKE